MTKPLRAFEGFADFRALRLATHASWGYNFGLINHEESVFCSGVQENEAACKVAHHDGPAKGVHLGRRLYFSEGGDLTWKRTGLFRMKV